MLSVTQGEHEEAIAASGQAIKARPDSVDAIYFRGHIYYTLGEYVVRFETLFALV